MSNFRIFAKTLLPEEMSTDSQELKNSHRSTRLRLPLNSIWKINTGKTNQTLHLSMLCSSYLIKILKTINQKKPRIPSWKIRKQPGINSRTIPRSKSSRKMLMLNSQMRSQKVQIHLKRPRKTWHWNQKSSFHQWDASSTQMILRRSRRKSI